MTTENRAATAACKAALADGLHKSRPTVALSPNGYVSEASENLIAGVRMEDFQDDLGRGAGGELKGKFLAAHSSSALAVNTFAPFKRDLPSLKLVGAGEFQCLKFERRCPSGLRGTPPHLDAVAVGAKRVIGIESKCLEHLSPHVAWFSDEYETKIVDARSQSRWFAAMRAIVATSDKPLWLDVAQLIKHAFGLARTFPEQRVTLLYLYWEPSNADEFPVFKRHREEVRAFTDLVAGDELDFVAISHPELWAQWEGRSEPAWLLEHIGRLRERYGVRA